jgi:hypothetical protein
MPQVGKAVAQFPAHAEVDAPGGGLRVSRYFDPVIGPAHTRLSIYDEDGRVTSVVALDDDQTRRLSGFLRTLAENEPTEQLVDPLKRLVQRIDFRP